MGTTSTKGSKAKGSVPECLRNTRKSVWLEHSELENKTKEGRRPDNKIPYRSL